MNNPQQTGNRFPTFHRVFSVLFAGRMLKLMVFVFACAATLLGLFYAVENWRGARANAVLKRELAEKGGPQEWKDLVPPTVTDEQNFAMTPFLAPLFDYKKDLQPGESKYRVRDTNAFQRTIHFAKELPNVPFKGGWRVGSMTELVAWHTNFARLRSDNVGAGESVDAVDRTTAAKGVLKALEPYGSVLDELRAASRRPHSRFNLRYDEENLWAILLPHLGVLNKASQILELRASAELALGKSDPALNDVLLMCDLADATRNEPFLVSLLVRITEMQLATQAIWEGCVEHRWSDAELQAIQTRLQKFDFLADLNHALQTERFAGLWTVEWLKKGDPQILGDIAGGPDAILRFAPRGWFDHEKLNYNRLFDQAFGPGFKPEAKRVFPKAADESSSAVVGLFEDGWSRVVKHRIVAALLLPAITPTLQKTALAHTGLDLAIVGCALERHRLALSQYPESLTALTPRFIAGLPTDILTGEQLKYRRTDDGKFLLYSVGWNEKDDAGMIARVDKSKSPGKVQDTNQGDWVWLSAARD
jgi:hypothetical protein